jgi:hypothetical protein
MAAAQVTRATSLISHLALLVLAGCTSAVPVRTLGSGGGLHADRGDTYRWSFDEPSSGPFVGTLPLEPPRRLFLDVLGRWAVEADDGAPSLPNVYRQRKPFGPKDVPRVLVSALTFDDLRAAVSCRPEAGALARGCGLVIRAEDEQSYDVAMIDALDGRVSLVHVAQGNETALAEATMPPALSDWRRLEVSAHLRMVSVSVDGVRLIDAREDEYRSGRVGLLTPADAISAFDDFEVTAE